MMIIFVFGLMLHCILAREHSEQVVSRELQRMMRVNAALTAVQALASEDEVEVNAALKKSLQALNSEVEASVGYNCSPEDAKALVDALEQQADKMYETTAFDKEMKEQFIAGIDAGKAIVAPPTATKDERLSLCKGLKGKASGYYGIKGCKAYIELVYDNCHTADSVMNSEQQQLVAVNTALKALQALRSEESIGGEEGCWEACGNSGFATCDFCVKRGKKACCRKWWKECAWVWGCEDKHCCVDPEKDVKGTVSGLTGLAGLIG